MRDDIVLIGGGMKHCNRCSKIIKDKYVMCINCYKYLKKLKHSKMKKCFFCRKPINKKYSLCYSCYSISGRSKKKNKKSALNDMKFYKNIKGHWKLTHNRDNLKCLNCLKSFPNKENMVNNIQLCNPCKKEMIISKVEYKSILPKIQRS